MLANEGADLSAHETRRRAAAHSESFAALAAEYQTLAAEAQQQRWDQLLEHCPLTPEQLASVRASPAYGPLLAVLRDAEAAGLPIQDVLPRLVGERTQLDQRRRAQAAIERTRRLTPAQAPVDAAAAPTPTEEVSL